MEWLTKPRQERHAPSMALAAIEAEAFINCYRDDESDQYSIAMKIAQGHGHYPEGSSLIASNAFNPLPQPLNYALISHTSLSGAESQHHPSSPTNSLQNPIQPPRGNNSV